MRFNFLVVFYFLINASAHAQVQVPNKLFSENFAFSVQSIDDFFDRFDFRKGTNFQEYYSKKFPDKNATRLEYIASLFDYNSASSFNTEAINQFLKQTNDEKNPCFLRYTDNGWFAEITCRVRYKKKLENIKLVLKVVGTSDNSYYWAILTANGKPLEFDSTFQDSTLQLKSDSLMSNNNEMRSRFFLSPVCHALEFAELDNVFHNKAHFTDYLYTNEPTFELKKLILLTQSNELKFVRVSNIVYHLLQIDGWIIKVERFNRPNRNSGWLISKLIKADTNEKRTYLSINLNLFN